MDRSFIRLIGAGLLVAAAWAQPAGATVCNSGGPVVFKPGGSAGPNQFTFQIPLSPALAGTYHYLLVDDFTEARVGVGIATGYINIGPSGPRSELYYAVGSAYGDEGVQFGSCRIRAHLLVNGGGTSTAYLVYKQGGVQSDGPGITVNTNYQVEYERVMPVNPVTNQPWVSDDLVLSGGIIGVKNDTGPTGQGVGLADIILECE